MSVESVLDALIGGRRDVAPGVVELTIIPKKGSVFPAFESGAHIDLYLPNGLVRQYSLCGLPSYSGSYRVAVLLEANGRGGSQCVHAELREGRSLRVSAPRNQFALVPAKHSILIAGGIGITPILSMATHLSSLNQSFELHYSARSRTRAAYVDEIEASVFAKEVQFHFDDEMTSTSPVSAALASPTPSTHAYLCGPPGFMQFVLETAAASGWSNLNLHLERFSPVAIDRRAERSFEIELASSGQVITVTNEQSVVQALAANGIDIPVSCEQGICGTCVLDVLAGVPDHRDTYLSEDEHATNKLFTPCCSRAVSARLVIQL